MAEVEEIDVKHKCYCDEKQARKAACKLVTTKPRRCTAATRPQPKLRHEMNNCTNLWFTVDESNARLLACWLAEACPYGRCRGAAVRAYQRPRVPHDTGTDLVAGLPHVDQHKGHGHACCGLFASRSDD